MKHKAFAIQFRELSRWDTKFFSASLGGFYPKVTLGDLIQEKSERVNLFDYPDQTFTILGVNNIGGVFRAYDIKGEKINQPYKKVYGQEIFYNPYRVNVGSIGIVPDELDGNYTSPAYVVFSIDDSKIIPRLLELILISDWYNPVLRAATAGSVRQNLTTDLLKSLKIPLPPLRIQQQIMTRWERAQTEIADAHKKITGLEEKIEVEFLSELGLSKFEYKNSIKSFAIWKRSLQDRWGVEVNKELLTLSELKKGKYEVVCLGDLIQNLENGWSPQCLDRPAEIDEWGVLKMGAVSFGLYNEDENKALPDKLEPRPKLEVKIGDWLISRANITRLVGACALVRNTRPQLMLCDKIFRAVWKDPSPVHKLYLDEVMKIPHLRQQIENNVTGTSPTMKNITKPSLLALQIPLPPLNVQQDLASKIQTQRDTIYAQKAMIKSKEQRAIEKIEFMILGEKQVESG